MEKQQIEDAILDHLHGIAYCKKAILQVAVTISNEYPSEAGVLLKVIKSMTSSADKLLGDTVTTSVPNGEKP